MFNRRFLRIKILQLLYAYFQDEGADPARYIKQLHHSIERSYDLYLFLLNLPAELTRQAENRIEEAKKKEILTEADKDPNLKFLRNLVIERIDESSKFTALCANRKISWSDQQETVSRFYKHLRTTPVYTEYMSDRENDFKKDRDFVIAIFRDVLPEFDLFQSNFHEKSIYWDEEDFDYASFLVVQTLKKLGSDRSFDTLVTPIFDDKEEKVFVDTLFRKTIGLNKEIEKEIVAKAKNWDLERIALIDMILIKMTISEVLHFNSIPVKVSMNEYIDIAKAFSSPKSGQFINGITDKIVNDLKSDKKFKKVGRGLME